MPVKLEAPDFIRLAHEMPIQSFAKWDSEGQHTLIEINLKVLCFE